MAEPSTPVSGSEIAKSQGVSPAGEPADSQIVIRGYSRVVLFWPTALASLLFYIGSGGAWNPATETESPRLMYAIGLWWMLVFAVNLTAFSFDFSRGKFIAFVCVLAAIIFGISALDAASESSVWGSVYDFFGGLKVAMNPNFYLCMFILFGGFFGLAFLRSRMDYWVLSRTELVHHYGFLGAVRTYPTMNLHVEKEIPDVFEWLLFGSGRLIFKPGNGNDVHVVENVYRVNRTTGRIKKFLGTLQVQQTQRP